MGRSTVSFGTTLSRVRSSLGLSQDDFGARLGVSRRTLTRWECHDELPPVGQRKHLATSFPDVPAALRAALVQTLGLDARFVATLDPPPPALAPALSPAAQVASAVDGAFLELCEGVDVAPGRLRSGLVAFLRRLEASGLSLDAVRSRLEPPSRARRGSAG
jgi:transcriptional regulator with XRE-family HTH domain